MMRKCDEEMAEKVRRYEYDISKPADGTGTMFGSWLKMQGMNWNNTFRGPHQSCSLKVKLGIDTEPHSGYPNDPNLVMTFPIYFDWALDEGKFHCRNYIWCNGAAKFSNDKNVCENQWSDILIEYKESERWNSNTFQAYTIYMPYHYQGWYSAYLAKIKLTELLDKVTE